MASLLYVLHHATDTPERTATALRTAAAALEAGHDVALWLSGEGVRLGVEGVADTLRAAGARPPSEALTALREGGARLFVERVSLEERQFSEDALLPGVEIADAARLADLVGEGRVPVTM